MAQYGQTWRNNSKSSMTLVRWQCTVDQTLGTVITSPAQQLASGDGMQSLTWSQELSTIAGGETDANIVWKTPSGKQFGVQIYVPLQVATIGAAPYYQVWWDGCGSVEWQGKRWSEPFTFDKNYLGFVVEVVPQAHHSNMFINITIKDI